MPDAASLFVHVIADYGPVGDMAFAEVRQALRAAMRDKIAHIELSPVPAFDTVATGFMLAQLAVNNHLGARQFFYVNTAPRHDDPKPRVNNAGEGLVYAKLQNGIQIVAVNSGYSLAFIKDLATDIRVIKCSAEGSQFRSRDVFPAAFGTIAHGDLSILGAAVDDIPAMPSSAVCYTDGYGNLKTSITADDIAVHKGREILVTIGEQAHQARVADGIFAVASGDLVLSAGSSGWINGLGARQSFVEISLRGSSAARLFKRPKGGTAVTWQVL